MKPKYKVCGDCDKFMEDYCEESGMPVFPRERACKQYSLTEEYLLPFIGDKPPELDA